MHCSAFPLLGVTFKGCCLIPWRIVPRIELISCILEVHSTCCAVFGVNRDEHMNQEWQLFIGNGEKLS